MSKLDSLIRQAEIIKLARKRAFDWQTLENHLARKEEDLDRDLIISKRTFNRDLAEINEFFGIAIKYDFKSGQYAIDTEGSSEQNIQLLEVFDTLQLFGKRGKVPSYVFMEQKVAKGTEHFSTIIKAIEQGKRIQITYGKYWKSETEERTLKPLALKEFKQRWYLLTFDENDQFKVFALDRVHELNLTNERFKVNQQIDFEVYFRDLFGIINTPGNPVEEVILTFSELKGRYIKSLPWHASQEILVDDGNILTIRLQVKIEYELISEILSHGDEVRVDAPESLKEIVRGKAGNMVGGQIK
ncbi:helix-turn-helix transcriptional regulator [Belliella kenyensis]|uniref:Helix-turn-helix transcriptional regulator n=1 Tax=Belliella kenyensis TaxID=1472724 RepID=A0ABV8EP35_9BACT|nr:WYL domain-containing protein [Belliella kenyensis]MCH7402878.1 WYL domain-containing protein [Belliella kenyensis]MDN3602584.1 WYL domain-containing protein [Belliella kenyensis]